MNSRPASRHASLVAYLTRHERRLALGVEVARRTARRHRELAAGGQLRALSDELDNDGATLRRMIRSPGARAGLPALDLASRAGAAVTDAVHGRLAGGGGRSIKSVSSNNCCTSPTDTSASGRLSVTSPDFPTEQTSTPSGCRNAPNTSNDASCRFGELPRAGPFPGTAKRSAPPLLTTLGAARGIGARPRTPPTESSPQRRPAQHLSGLS